MATRHPGGKDAGYEQLVDSILIDLTSSFGADDTLGGTRTYTEGGAAVVLDPDARIFDVELAAQGNYGGATSVAALGGMVASVPNSE